MLCALASLGDTAFGVVEVGVVVEAEVEVEVEVVSEVKVEVEVEAPDDEFGFPAASCSDFNAGDSAACFVES